MSPELALLRAPMRAYARLVEDSLSSWRSLGGRLALVAVVIGCSVAISSTGHVTVPLVLTTIVCWSPVVLLQLAIALFVVGRPASRTTGLARGLDLFFMAHVPWSLWILAFAALVLSADPVGLRVRAIEVTAIVPLAWTARLVYAYHVQVLRADGLTALRRTLLHQALTWGVAAVIFWNSIWPRAIGLWA